MKVAERSKPAIHTGTSRAVRGPDFIGDSVDQSRSVAREIPDTDEHRTRGGEWVERDRVGGSVRSMGISRDITHTKPGERMARILNENYRRLQANIRAACASVDMDGRCNRPFELLLGYRWWGIAEGSQKRLFELFYFTKADGLGMGHRLAQSIIRSHGGCIEGNNNPDGGGACFQVFIPAHRNFVCTKV